MYAFNDERGVWKGAEALSTLLVDIQLLTPDPRNARRHPERNLQTITRSLDTYGQLKPIVGRRGGPEEPITIIAGNGTYEAAKALGWTLLAVVRVDEMSAEQATAFGLMDNRSAELAEWDLQEVAALMAELPPELRLETGWADFEIDPLLKAEWTPPPLPQPEGKKTDTTRVNVSFTAEQFKTVERAIESLREREGDKGIPQGRAIELALADWLS